MLMTEFDPCWATLCGWQDVKIHSNQPWSTYFPWTIFKENSWDWWKMRLVGQRKCKQQGGEKVCYFTLFLRFQAWQQKTGNTLQQVSFVGWNVGNNDKKHTISFDRSLLLGEMLATMTKTTQYPSTGFFCWVKCWQQWQKTTWYSLTVCFLFVGWIVGNSNTKHTSFDRFLFVGRNVGNGSNHAVSFDSILLLDEREVTS